jgi:hypothetical protein
VKPALRLLPAVNRGQRRPADVWRVGQFSIADTLELNPKPNLWRKIVKPVLSQFLAATAVGAATLLAVFLAVSPTSAQVTFGSLSNFDVINDTGQPCNGFEIELEGVTPAEVVYTFGENPADPTHPYIRYGKPAIVPNVAGTGVIVRYASPYDSGAKRFTEATPAATAPYPVTMGHQCWTFGDPVNYPTSGCEHFGVSLLGNATKTTYRWLVGDNATGTLKVAGTTGNPSIPAPVYVPAPVWNVIPQPPPAPNLPPPPPIVAAVVQAPPAPPVPPGGKGQWGMRSG